MVYTNPLLRKDKVKRLARSRVFFKEFPRFSGLPGRSADCPFPHISYSLYGHHMKSEIIDVARVDEALLVEGELVTHEEFVGSAIG